MRTLQSHDELFRQAVSMNIGDDGIALLSNLEGRTEFWNKFDAVASIVCELMLRTGESTVHVLEPKFCENEDGSITGFVYELSGEDHAFRARVTVGAGIYYHLSLLGGHTLLDLYENLLEDNLKADKIEAIAKSFCRQGRFSDLAEMEAAFFEDYLPPFNDSKTRGYFDHGFYYQERRGGKREISYANDFANRLALATLYYPELAFWSPPLDKQVETRQEQVTKLMGRLELLRILEPLIRKRILFPVCINMQSDRNMNHWLDHMVYLSTEHESKYLHLAEQVYGDTKYISVSEHMEVYAQASVAASLCGAHDVHTDRLFYLFTQYLAGRGELPLDGGLHDIASGPILDAVLLPTLEQCPTEDVIALRQSGEHLDQFRSDFGAILDHVAIRESAGGKPTESALIQIEMDVLKTRLDSLTRDVEDSSLKPLLKNSGWSFSVGLMAGFAVGGNLLSSVAAGALTELSMLGVNIAKGRRKRSASRALGQIYSSLIDTNRKR